MIQQRIHIRDEFKDKVKNFCSLHNVKWDEKNVFGDFLVEIDKIVKVMDYIDKLEQDILKEQKLSKEAVNSALHKTNVSRSLLSYEEAAALCLKTKWKVTPCDSGEQCWCRLIVPETEIEDKDGNEIYIAGSGCIPKVYAEHIVNLHNESLNCR